MIGLLRYVLAILVSSFGSNIRLEAENAALKLLYAFVIVCLQGPCLDQHQRINLSSWCACQARGRPRRCSAPLRLAARISDITCLVWPAGRPVAATSPHPSTTRTSYSARCVRWTSWSTLPAHATAQPTYGALNPRSIWTIVVLVMAISAAGYIAVRTLGDRYGLALAGLASGFISSIATIGAMGARTRTTPTVLGAAVAGAVLSTLATIMQMCAVLAATSMTVLQVMSVPLLCAGLAAAAYGAFFTIKAMRGTKGVDSQAGHAFSFSSAIILAVTLSGNPGCLRGVAGKLRRNRRDCRRRVGGFCGYAFGGGLDRFAGRVGEDECGRRDIPHPCRALDQHDQQDHRRMDQWGTIFRFATDPGATPGHFGGMGGCIRAALARTVIDGDAWRRRDGRR